MLIICMAFLATSMAETSWVNRYISHGKLMGNLTGTLMDEHKKVREKTFRKSLFPKSDLSGTVTRIKSTLTISHLVLNSIPTTPCQGTVAGLPQASG